MTKINWKKVKVGDIVELKDGYGTRKVVSPGFCQSANESSVVYLKGLNGTGRFWVPVRQVEAVYRIIK